MHYYQFNIGDYHSHTAHLEPLEDIAYRRMMDFCYLNEIPLPPTAEEIARLIRMRSHTDCIAVVLSEFFTEVDEGYIQQRINDEVAKYREKSAKAKKSAEARWSSKSKALGDANALQAQSEGNAKHKPLTTNHKPITKEIKNGRFTPPEQKDLTDYFTEKGSTQMEAEKFMNHFTSNGWKIGGKAAMKCWKAAVRTWISRNGNSPTNNSDSETFL